jgi:hypothetical protein
MLGRHWTKGYFWIPKHVFDINIDFKRINQAEDIPIPAINDKILLIVDNQVRNSLSDRDMSTIKKYNYYYHTLKVMKQQKRAKMDRVVPYLIKTHTLDIKISFRQSVFYHSLANSKLSY